MKVFVTGGAGFRLTYAGNLGNLSGLDAESRYRFVQGDIADPEIVDQHLDSSFDAIINFAAESHVDRSILDSSDFLNTNVEGTRVLLEAARKKKISRFLQVSTDEVYGSLGSEGSFTESSQIAPNSPYAASKASADCFARAYHRTYGMNTMITRCSNNYGPYQFPEKLIPLMILNAYENKALPVYGDGLYVRDWIHVEDHCRALDAVLQRGNPGEVYNIGGNEERTNLEVIRQILDTVGRGEELIQYVPDRPGHDRRYAIDSSLIKKELGWTPSILFREGLDRTISWYQDHADWVAGVRSGDYRNYYDRMYERRGTTLADL
jgi:dTDP-glucose 4,6-dehydratase